MQADRAIAERELRLQERHHVALHVDGVDVEAGEEEGIPGGVAGVRCGARAFRFPGTCPYARDVCWTERRVTH